MSSESNGQTSRTSSYPVYNAPQKQNSSRYVSIGVFCAIIALIVLPEIFGLASVILGAYAFRLDCGTTSKRGLWVAVLGVVFMLIGIYYTSIFGLYQILP